MTPTQRSKIINIIADERVNKATYDDLRNEYKDSMSAALRVFTDEYLLEQLIEINTL
jgi:hypothetical protein